MTRSAAHRQKRGQQAEDDRDLQRVEIVRIRKHRAEIGKPNEAALQTEGVFAHERLIESLARRPEEEDDREHDLRGDEDIGQDLVRENDALHSNLLKQRMAARDP
jgi:hypothetical protein